MIFSSGWLSALPQMSQIGISGDNALPNVQRPRRTGRNDRHRDAPAGVDAMKGCKAWADRAHAVYENKNKPNPS
jgi:hypothetical protein